MYPPVRRPPPTAATRSATFHLGQWQWGQAVTVSLHWRARLALRRLRERVGMRLLAGTYKLHQMQFDADMRVRSVETILRASDTELHEAVRLLVGALEVYDSVLAEWEGNPATVGENETKRRWMAVNDFIERHPEPRERTEP